MTLLYLKSIFNNKSLRYLYLLALVLIVLISLNLGQNKNQKLLTIAIADLSQSEQSKHYINSLKKNNMLQIVEIEKDSITKTLTKAKADCALLIPADFFTNNNAQIKLHYLESNSYISALVDILALPLLPDIMAKHINKAAIRYEHPAELKPDYLNLINSLDDNIKIKINIDLKQLGTQSEQSIKKREKAENKLLTIIFITIILIIYPSNSFNQRNTAAELRLNSIENGRLKIFVSKYSALILCDALACILSVGIIGINLSLKPLTIFILFLYCQNILLFFRLIIKLFFDFLDTGTAAMISMLIIIISAITGGTFFDAALMGNNVQQFGNILSFGSIRLAFSELFYTGLLEAKQLIVFAIYLMINSLLLYYYYKNTSNYLIK